MDLERLKKQIEWYRIVNGLTIEETAKRCSVSLPTFYKVLGGQKVSALTYSKIFKVVKK